MGVRYSAHSFGGVAGKSLRSMVVEDAMIQAAMQPWIQMECFQLGRGNQLGQIDSIDLGTQQIVRERQEVAVQKLGVTPPNLCTVSCCTPDPTFRFSDVCLADKDTVFFMPGDNEFDIYVPAGARTVYISFDQEEFLNAARTLNPSEWENAPEHLIRLPTARQADLERLVRKWVEVTDKTHALGEAIDGDLMGGTLLQDILGLVTTSHSCHPSPMDRSRAFHICRTARAYVEDRMGDDALPTITDICRELRVSERALQYAFRAYAAMPPLRYLRLCRLNQVRAGLSQPSSLETTVTEVAVGYGFFHLGNFAGEYRLLFGELPSVTLARGLAQAA